MKRAAMVGPARRSISCALSVGFAMRNVNPGGGRVALIHCATTAACAAGESCEADRVGDLLDGAREDVVVAAAVGPAVVALRDQGEELREQVHAASARCDHERRHVVEPGAGFGAVWVVIEDEVGQRDETLGAREKEDVACEELGRLLESLLVRAVDGLVCSAAVIQVLEKLR